MTSNRLPVLAAEIRRAHADVQDAARTAAERAIEAGERLIEAKELVPHGGWLPFLADTGIPERTAQRYMRIAAARLKYDTVSDLGGIVPALRFITLRERAMTALDEAEAEALAGRDGIQPMERACGLMSEMAAMFPPLEART